MTSRVVNVLSVRDTVPRPSNSADDVFLNSRETSLILPLKLELQIKVALGNTVPSLSTVVVSLTLNPNGGITINGLGRFVFGLRSRSTSSSIG